jgi:S1-C subfamily serine protease
LYNKKFNSFITQHPALPGMSGGPIFNMNGQVIGLTSANYTRKVQRNPEIQIHVENGIGVNLEEINRFLQTRNLS